MLLGEAAATHFGNSAGGSAQSLHHKQEEQYQKGLGYTTSAGSHRHRMPSMLMLSMPRTGCTEKVWPTH
jgi:hypothetical protein